MCGIVGMISFHQGGLMWSDINSFCQMLYVDAVRGMHGTGSFAVDASGDQWSLRVGGPPHQLFSNKKWDEYLDWLRKKKPKFLVGHNRLATKGQKITAHTHPFTHGHIRLVHNGTLENYDHLPDAKKFEVDSEAICYSIAKQGIDKTIGSLRGAWTLVYYDEKEQTLNLLRNKERPLFMAKHKQYGLIAFASEAGILNWVLNRNNLSNYELSPLPEDTLLTFKMNEEKPKVREVKGKGFWSINTDVFDADYYGTGFSETKQKPEEEKKKIKKQESSDYGTKSSQVVPFREKVVAQVLKPNASRKPTNLDETGSWTGVEHLHDLSRGKSIQVMVYSHVPIEDTTDRFQIICLSDDYPDIEFYCNIKGESEVLKFNETGLLEATIMSILKSQVHVSKFPHKIFLSQAKAVSKSN